MATSSDPSAASRCLDCGTDRVGPWCHKCGQPAPQPLRFTRIAGDLLEHLTDLGRAPGIADTVRRLTVRPGTAIGAWVDGQRGSLVNPVKYAFLMLTVLAVTVDLTGTDAGRGLGLEERSAIEQKALAVTNALLAYLSFISLLVVAVVQRWLFRGRRAMMENLCVSAVRRRPPGHSDNLGRARRTAGISRRPRHANLGFARLHDRRSRRAPRFARPRPRCQGHRGVRLLHHCRRAADQRQHRHS